MQRESLLLFLFLSASVARLSAQNSTELGELSTERPGFTSSSGVVGLGVLQLEQGYSLSSVRVRSGSRTESNFSGPSGLIRLGLTDKLEVRVTSNGYSWEMVQASGVKRPISGLNDFGLGAKAKLVKQHGAWPEISMAAAVSVPARGSAFTSSGHDPSVTLAASKDLPGKISLSLNSIIGSVTDPHGRYLSAGQTVWVARGLKFVSGFGEVFRTTIGRQEGSEVAAGFGLFRNIGKNVQVDVEIGHTLSGSQPGWFANGGLVFRAPRPVLSDAWYRNRF